MIYVPLGSVDMALRESGDFWKYFTLPLRVIEDEVQF